MDSKIVFINKSDAKVELQLNNSMYQNYKKGLI